MKLPTDVSGRELIGILQRVGFVVSRQKAAISSSGVRIHMRARNGTEPQTGPSRDPPPDTERGRAFTAARSRSHSQRRRPEQIVQID